MSTEEEVPTPLIHEVVSGEAQGPQTLQEQLRAKRQEIAETRDVLIPVTGYQEVGLQAKHRLIDRVEVEMIGKAVVRETKDRGERNVRILCATIINSTVGFYTQDASEETPVPLLGPNGEEVLRWDQLASFLGWEPGENGSARTALYYIFGDNEFAIGQYGIALNRWMGNTSMEVDVDFLGEGV